MPLSIYYFLMFSAIYILVGWGIYLNYRNGQICFTPYIAMIIGAYFTALTLRDLSWPFGIVLLGAIAMGAVFALVSGLFLARLGPLAMALVTLALIFVIQTVIRNVDFLGGVPGIFFIPSVTHLMPIALTATALVGFFMYRFDHSRLGRAMEVAFTDPEVAATLGTNLFWTSVFLQVAGGAIGALAGAVYAPLIGSVAPVNFGFTLLLAIYCFLFVGGYTNMWGVVVFAPLLWGLRLVLPGEIASWTMIIYGALLVGIVVGRPEGVITKQALRSIRLRSQALLGRMRGSCK